ncbi:hypothetical protein ACP70R_030763 [Stipagrostis hirtigluma subsp. patula]
MVLRFLSRTPPRDPASRDSPPADSPPPTSQGGSSNGAKAAVGRKTKEEVDHLLAKLEEEGVEIDEKITSIIDDGMARIKAEAERKKVRDETSVLHAIACLAVGFVMGVEWYLYCFRKEMEKRYGVPPNELAKSRRA